ncbi:unnamed protein product [Thlaspi arvense]|uniref:WRKY domain-containing protein n=1 Tax=Thlaspi arvense TaxID=13288 RepID=A0AAU9SFX1_THLAR|nr:unnamed protein product [Thlaspi arvense]
MENVGVGMQFSDLGQTSDLTAERCTVGFMDLLGVHQGISRNTLIHPPPMQFPATATPPNSSYEAVTGEEKKRGYGESIEKEHKRNKRLGEQTKARVPKVSFITKSQINNLDDGYKWRKYGQKPVRNSPFPRNYYRCTTYRCDVKKRVERSFSDPSNIITTYEGQHTHPTPLIMSNRSSFVSNGSASRSHFGLPRLPPQLHHRQQQHQLSLFGKQEKGFGHDDDHVMNKSRTHQGLLDGAGLVKDHGLLQDVVSSHIIKEEH